MAQNLRAVKHPWAATGYSEDFEILGLFGIMVSGAYQSIDQKYLREAENEDE